MQKFPEEENIEDTAEKVAWKKCKLLIKKKIEEHKEELAPLIEEQVVEMAE